MRVPKETTAYLKSRGIKIHAMRTGKAVDLFNELQKDAILVAALHLTC
jgi:hypothetical protein